MSEIDGRHPNVDALVAMRRALGLPQGAALSIFAVARSVGWIAHALEQQGGRQADPPAGAMLIRRRMVRTPSGPLRRAAQAVCSYGFSLVCAVKLG